MTWARVKDYVAGELAREGSTITDASLLVLANEAVDEISDSLQPRTHVWTGGDLLDPESTDGIQSGRLPQDIIGPLFVTVDGAPLTVMNIDDFEGDFLHALRLESKSYAVSGGRLYTSINPLSRLRIRAGRYLPYFVIPTAGPPEVLDTNPMQYLPRGYELLPAYYVLMMYRAGSDTPIEMVRLERNAARWASGIEKASMAVKRLGGMRFRF